MTNSTFTQNQADDGAAIDNGSTISVTGSTLAANEGITLYSLGTLHLAGTIIAGSGGHNCSYGYNTGSLLDDGYNLEWSGPGNTDTCGLSAGSHDITGKDPLLDPKSLADNGGPTPTIALLAGSPAVDAIPAGSLPGWAPSTDQRGATRPQGAGDDIGAYELASAADITAPVISPSCSAPRARAAGTGPT